MKIKYFFMQGIALIFLPYINTIIGIKRLKITILYKLLLSFGIRQQRNIL